MPGIADVTLHDLRHAYGSRLASRGLTARQIADAMGHKRTSTTEIYIQRFNGDAADERRSAGDEWLVGSKTGSKGERPARTANFRSEENPPFAAGSLMGAAGIEPATSRV
jgi:transposase InsO family protein